MVPRSAEISSPFELAGTAEAAGILGVSRQRLTRVAAMDGFPRPLARLASGPVWDAAALRDFEASRDRRPGRRPAAPARTAPYYAEVAWTDRDARPARTVFRAWLGTAETADDAERQAVADCAAAHPESSPEPFLTRRLTKDKATSVRRRMDAGTWAGWYA